MGNFNAKAARAKRPCPIWADAFQRDTQHLAADEVGAYFLILMAMWTRESCDLPDDDARLARVARISPTLWKRRVGPVIRAFLLHDDGVVLSKRLRQEADFVEHGVELQSRRKTKKYDDKSLKSNNTPRSMDTSTDGSAVQPTQQPNNPTYKGGGGGGAREVGITTFRERILEAMGVGPDGVIGPSVFIGSQSDMTEAARWLHMPGLSEDAICAEIADIMRGKADGPPRRFSYFTAAMQRLSAAITAPPLSPAKTSTRSSGRVSERRAFDQTVHAIADQLGEGTVHLDTSSRDPFARRG